MMRKLLYVLLTALAVAVLALAADVNIRIDRNGAPRSQARTKDRIVWTGNNWSVEFPQRSPCQNGKKTFSSTENGQDRICVISVTCSGTDKSGCGVYKYNSRADGGPVVDPEIEVTFP
jgi:hypothetical protein